MEKPEKNKKQNLDARIPIPVYEGSLLLEQGFFEAIDAELAKGAKGAFELYEKKDPKTGAILEQKVIDKKSGKIVFYENYEFLKSPYTIKEN